MTVNTQELDAGFAWMVSTHGASMQFAGRDMMRVLCNNLVSLTFPKNAKEGRRAIDADTNKTFAALDAPEAVGFFNKAFGDGSYTKGGKLRGKKRQARASQRLPGVTFNWSGDQSAMKRHHEQHRVRGRVKRRPGTVRLGPWTFERSMYVTKTAMRKFRRTKYKSVAKIKAGWASAAAYFARVTGGRLVLPAFVRKQEDKRGTYRDAFTKDGNGFASATNLITYASRLTRFIYQRAAMKTNAYMDLSTQKQIDKIVERYNRMEGKPPQPQTVRP